MSMAGEGITSNAAPAIDFSQPFSGEVAEGQQTNVGGRQPLEWSYQAFDPNANSFQDPLSDNVMVQTFSPYYPSVSGAFPSWFPQQFARNQVGMLLRSLSAPDIVRLKQRLFAARYLTGGVEGEETLSGYYAAPPMDPTIDAATELAFLNLFDDAATQSRAGGGSQTLDSWLNTRIQAEAGKFQRATAEKYDLSGQVEPLQAWAEKNLGRRFRDEEVQELFRITSSPRSSAEQPYQGGFGSAEGDVAAGGVTLRGGGQGSTALSFLNQLTRVYGLQPVTSSYPGDSVFDDGRAMEVTGDPARLQMLQQWASTSLGENGVFEKAEIVSVNPDDPNDSRLILAVRDGATPPPVNGIDYAYQSFGDDVSRFLGAVRRPGGEEAYVWDNSQLNQHGAYGLSTQIWDYYTTQVFKNMDPNDHSREAQDAVARAYANDLYSGKHNWQNWEDVAYAFTVNEDVARQNRGSRSSGLLPVRPEFGGNQPRFRVNNILNNMAKSNMPSSNTATFRNDLYSQMFGAGTGQGAPYVSDPFAELPSTPGQFGDQLMYNVNRQYADERSHANILGTIVELVSKHGINALKGKGQ